MGGIQAERAASLADAVVNAAEREAKPVSVAVVDEVGALLWFQRMDGAPRYSADFAVAKARTAATFGAATSSLEELYASRPAFAQSFIAQGGYFLGRGGIPVLRDGRVLGAVGVSGADAHGEEQLAQAAVAEVYGG
jgi:uncharacterized protein GlcG (DUF336 family)